MRPRLHAPHPQRGISLIVAMLMLVIIGIMSVAVMRNVTSTDQVATGNRLQTQANQAAQMALRFCEDQLNVAGGPVTVYKPARTPPAWTVKANWTTKSADQAYTLKSGDIQGGAANFPPVPPQCLAEVSATDSSVYTVTARGFSADYTHDDNFNTRTGSVIWLQSTVYMP